MENRKSLKCIYVIFLGVLLSTPYFLSAYSIATHYNITEKTFFVYEDLFGETFSSEEVDLAAIGSKEEDTFESKRRPLNHFYDPVNKHGLRALGFFSVKNISGGLASPVWAIDTEAQANFLKKRVRRTDKYFSSPTDFSWDRAVYEYVHGDRERAIKTLGHILHLVQDSTSPAHVRNDDHLMGDPYEDFTRGMSPADDLHIVESNLPEKDTIGDLIKDSALFTNRNFLSKDTIFEDYIEPSEKAISIWDSVEISGDIYLFGYNDYGKLVASEKFRNKANPFVLRERYIINDPDDLILTDYWNTLSRRAVIGGVGVIRLFFDAVEVERKTLALKGKNKSEAEKAFAKLRPGGFDLAKGLYGSSLTNEDVKELLGEGGSQGAATILAVEKKETKPIQENISPEESIQNTNGTGPVGEVESSIIESGPASEELVAVEPEVPAPVALNESKDQGSTFEDPNTQKLFAVPIQGGGGGGAAPATQSPVQDTSAPDAPAIISPSDFSKTFTSSSILFSGTAEADSTIATDLSPATTTVSGAEEWSFGIGTFPQGTTTVQFFAVDASGNVSPATSVTLFVDSDAPIATLDIAECADSLSSSACLVATTTLSISWSSGASDLAHFVINSNGTTSTTTATSTTAVANDNSTFFFSVSAVDTAGNTSLASTQEVQVATSPVVINEVAWAGNAGSTADEWIELYNPTNSEISLAGWTLYAEDGTPYIPLSKTISARGYYLIERTDDDSVADIPADLIAPFSGLVPGSGLGNSGEHLILARYAGGATTTIDEILKCNNWCGKGNTFGYTTAERYDAHGAGTDWGNWGSNIMIIKNGLSFDDRKLNGTPKQRNSVSHLVNKNKDTSTDITLKKSESPYVVNNTTVNIGAGATLAIEPGVVIKFYNNARLSADGNIVASGTAGDPIVFTSFTDDSHGGDMNGDGICDPDNASSTALCPGPGEWFGVELSSQSIGSSFAHTMFRYGGKYYTGQLQKRANLYIDGVSPPITNSVFEYSKQYGLYLSNASSTVSSNVFRNNKQTNSSAGIYGGGGAPTISGNQFTNNGQGLYFSNSGAQISTNIFTNNSYRAVGHQNVFTGSFSGNTGSGNNTNGISLIGTITQENATTTLDMNSLPYLIIDSDITVSASSTLVVGQGAIFKFKDKHLNVRGRLVVDGANGTPVIFTSAYDDSDGNDALNDGPSVGSANRYQGLYMKSGSSSDIDNAEFRYLYRGVSYENPSPIDLENVLFSNNDLGVSAVPGETILKADNITFVDNVATSTIPLIVP